MTHWYKLRGHFGDLRGLPLTQFRVVFDVSLEYSWNKRNVWKGIRLFSWLENFRRKFGFHVFKPFLNISFGLSRSFFVKRNWLGQMVNAITERNQNSSVLNSVHHLPKPWSDRFTPVNSRKALCPKACDTASSHRYLPQGTFRQRAVRGGCIADYASYILSTLRGLVKCIVARSNGRSLQYLLLLFKRHQHKTRHSSTPDEC